MAFDIEAEMDELVPVHPDAVSLFNEASQALFTLDVGPLGSDRGADGRTAYLEWRQAHPGAPLATYLQPLVDACADAYDAAAVTDGELSRRLRADAADDFDVELDELHAMDEGILAAALMHVVATGILDASARAIVDVALTRQQHPGVLERLFGSAVELRREALAEVVAVVEAAVREPAHRKPRSPAARRMTKLRGTRIYPPSATSASEGELIVMMEGGVRPGGIWVSPAGKTHLVLSDAIGWKLQEAGFEVPGFDEIYFHPTTALPPGQYEVAPIASSMFFRGVRMGVELESFKAICRGQAIAEGVDLFGGAVAALAEQYDLDRALVERVRADFRQHGLDREVVVRRGGEVGNELRAMVGLRADGKHQLAVEHVSSEGVRRAVVVPAGASGFFVPARLELAKTMLEVVPARGAGATVKVKLKDMGLAGGG